ncbi:MAG: DNA polymerase III subunit gamma/tau [Aquirufa sp.]
MENFIVSARKYRPTQFDSVVGQSHITTTLKNAIRSNHLAQAFLFCGPRGVGKTTCARILAKTINCENLQADGEACGQCDSCKSFQENTSLAIHELDAASNNSVDDIRNLIDQVRYPPQGGKYKIYIIDEVHMLSPAAFNAFLKTLEEPPSYAIFILATTEKHKILPTILSRCQIFDFNRIQWKDMASHLNSIAEKEGIQAEPLALELISIKADGGLRDALSMFDLNVTFSTDNVLRHKDVLENLHILDSDYYFKLTDHFIDQNHSDSLLLIDEVMRKGFDGHQFISGLMEHLRNLLFAKDPKTLALMDFGDEIKVKFQQQSAKTSASFILSAMNICAQCEIHYKSAKNPRLHLELSILKITYLPSVYQPVNQPVVEGGDGKKSNTTTEKVVENSSTPTANIVPENKPIVESNIHAPVTTAEQPSTLQANTSQEVVKEVQIPAPTSIIQNTLAAQKPVSGGSGLRSAKKIIDNNSQKESNNSNSNGNIHEMNHPFTFEDIKREWHFIAEEFKAHNFINKYVMMNRPFELIETILHIKVENEVQVQQFNENIRLELLSTLRDKLKNQLIDIELDIIEYVKNDKRALYTQSDKYDYLANKYPLLVEMKQKFGLDHEF